MVHKIEVSGYKSYRSKEGPFIICFFDNDPKNIQNQNLQIKLENVGKHFPNVPILKFDFHEFQKIYQYPSNCNEIYILDRGNKNEEKFDPNEAEIGNMCNFVKKLRTERFIKKNPKHIGNEEKLYNTVWKPTNPYNREYCRLKSKLKYGTITMDDLIMDKSVFGFPSSQLMNFQTENSARNEILSIINSSNCQELELKSPPKNNSEEFYKPLNSKSEKIQHTCDNLKITTQRVHEDSNIKMSTNKNSENFGSRQKISLEKLPIFFNNNKESKISDMSFPPQLCQDYLNLLNTPLLNPFPQNYCSPHQTAPNFSQITENSYTKLNKKQQDLNSVNTPTIQQFQNSKNLSVMPENILGAKPLTNLDKLTSEGITPNCHHSYVSSIELAKNVPANIYKNKLSTKFQLTNISTDKLKYKKVVINKQIDSRFNEKYKNKGYHGSSSILLKKSVSKLNGETGKNSIKKGSLVANLNSLKFQLATKAVQKIPKY